MSVPTKQGMSSVMRMMGLVLMVLDGFSSCDSGSLLVGSDVDSGGFELGCCICARCVMIVSTSIW